MRIPEDLTDEERRSLALQASYRASDHLDLRYHQQLTSDERQAGHDRWTAIQTALWDGPLQAAT